MPERKIFTWCVFKPINGSGPLLFPCPITSVGDSFTSCTRRMRALFANGWGWICKIFKIFFFKIYHNILIFYITSIIFYHFLNKKITTKQKISLFYTKHSYFFFHINQICYSTSPLPPVQSICKHSLQVHLCVGLQQSRKTLGCVWEGIELEEVDLYCSRFD